MGLSVGPREAGVWPGWGTGASWLPFTSSRAPKTRNVLSHRTSSPWSGPLAGKSGHVLGYSVASLLAVLGFRLGTQVEINGRKREKGSALTAGSVSGSRTTP